MTESRSSEDVKREIEAERERLGAAVGTLRTRAGAAVRKLPLVVLGAAGVGLGARSVRRRIARSDAPAAGGKERRRFSFFDRD